MCKILEFKTEKETRFVFNFFCGPENQLANHVKLFLEKTGSAPEEIRLSKNTFDSVHGAIAKTAPHLVIVIDEKLPNTFAKLATAA